MSLLPGKTDFVSWKGGTWRKVLTLYTGATTSTDPRDLTGYTGRMHITSQQTDATLMDLTTGNGGVILGDEAGTITLYISDEATLAATWPQGKYLLTVTSGAGDTDPILYGRFYIKDG